MHRSIPAVVLALLLFLGAHAAAESLATRFPEVSGEVAARLGALPTTGLTRDERRLRANLNKAAKALAKDAADLALTLKFARKAMLRIDTSYPGDAEFAPLLDALVEGLKLDVTTRGGAFSASVQDLPDGTAKTRAEALDAASQLEIQATFDAPTRADSLTHLSTANALIVKGQRVVRRAGGGTTAATNSLDVNIDGNPLHLPPASGEYTYTAIYDQAMDSFILSARGTIDTTQHIFALRVMSPGAGPHPVQGGPSSTYTSSAIAPQPPFVLMPGATIDFTTWDPDNGKIAGTFSASFNNGTTTVALTNGRFSRVP